MTDTAKPAKPASFGPYQLADHLGVGHGQIDDARTLGLLPDPDVGGRRWSRDAAGDIRARWDDIAAVIEDQRGLGAVRIAEQLGEATGMEVDRADVPELAGAGWLRVVGAYKDWPLYAMSDAEKLADDERGVEALAAIIGERQAWIAASLTRREAADQLGWHVREFDRVAGERGLSPGRFGRYDRADIDTLAGDEELAEQVVADRLLGPNQAAEHLEVRRTDFDYCTAAGWITPTSYVDKPVGRRSEVTVPLYRAGDLDDLRWLPGVDWEAVRAAKPGEASPLREYVRKPPTRAQIVHAFVTEIGQTWGVEAFGVYLGGPGVWEIDWCLDGQGNPTRAEVETLAVDNPAIAAHRDAVRLSTEAGAAIRWARAMLEPGAAVILDTETTDLPGTVCDIAVIDAATGATLLDTLVNPQEPIAPGAAAVHGLTDGDVAGAPTWPEVLPTLLEVTAGRTVLAYNADYDHDVVRGDCARHGLDPAHLASRNTWGCVMNRRSDWARMWRFLPLDGGHRALGDTQVTLDMLRTMTVPEKR